MPTLSLRQRTVLGVAGMMAAVHLGVRAWAIFPSWFYTDDYRLLYDATGEPLSLTYLLSPFDSQLMPFGRALAWLVAASGDVDWTLAASLTLTLQGVAVLTCAWMVFTLFGVRMAALLPLGVYLSSAITAPAFMWWAASLNQLPLQSVFFASVTTWVRYLRSGERRWLAATSVLLAVGLLCYVKTLLVFGVLAFLALAYFRTGSPWSRLTSSVRAWWPALAVLGALGTGYFAYYVTQVPQVFTEGEQPVAAGLARTMLGIALPVGALGGPWRWDVSNPPTGYADPPSWSVALVWAALVLLVLLAARRRTAILPALALLGTYAVVDFLLVLTSRAQVAGSLLGYEYRYLTDAVPVLALSVGLATMPLLGAHSSSQSRVEASHRAPQPPGNRHAVLAGGLALVFLSGLWSNISYAQIWHTNHPGERYVQAAQQSLRGQGPVDLADQVVPPVVIPGFSAPYNTTKRLLPLVVDGVAFPEVTSRLVVLDRRGTAQRAEIDAKVTSLPGPDEGCGWKLEDEPVTIAMNQASFDFGWWVRIGYLASASDTLTIRAGDTETEARARQGLHSIYLRAEGSIDSVTVRSTGAAVLCIDTVEVGQPIPGGPL